jgi:hypothetical protein
MLRKAQQMKETAWRTTPDLMVGILLVTALTASSSAAFAAWLAERAKEVSR